MTDDSDREIGDLGGSDVPATGDLDSSQPRHFRGWSSARDMGGPTVWSRMRGRIARIFARRRAGNNGVVREAIASTDSPVAPPDDFKFPWSRPEESSFASVDAALPSGDSGAAEGKALHSLGDVPVPSAPAELARLDEAIELTEQKTDEFVTAGAADIRETPPVDEAVTPRQSRFARWLQQGRRKPVASAEGAATVIEGNPVFLYSKFRAFYKEIIRARHQKTEFSAGFSTHILGEHPADSSPEATAEALSKRLVELLELQAAEAKWMGGEAGARYPDAQYAMAALADEIFSHAEWDGQAAWPQLLLEVKLFKSRAADIELFRRIDKLLKECPNTPVARDLGRVYLLVLAAGFQGKYRPVGLTRVLAEYRQRLFEYVHHGDALMLYAPDRSIFPDTGAHTLVGKAVSRFTAAQRWTALLAFLVIAYVIAAHLAWGNIAEDLEDVTGRIRASSSTAEAGR